MNTPLKRIASFGLVAVFAVPLVLQAPVFARDGEDHKETTTKTETTSNDKKSRDSRIADWKKKYRLMLSEKQKTTIKSRCKAANIIVSNTGKRISSFEKKRPAQYTKLHNRLEALVPKLKAEGVDTKTLESQLAELKIRIATFNTDIAAYKQAVADLAAMDCAADGEGFVATVKQAIELRKAVVQSGRNIRQYLKETVKPTLKQAQTDLVATKPEEES